MVVTGPSAALGGEEIESFVVHARVLLIYMMVQKTTECCTVMMLAYGKLLFEVNVSLTGMDHVVCWRTQEVISAMDHRSFANTRAKEVRSRGVNSVSTGLDRSLGMWLCMAVRCRLDVHTCIFAVQGLLERIGEYGPLCKWLNDI